MIDEGLVSQALLLLLVLLTPMLSRLLGRLDDEANARFSAEDTELAAQS